MKASRSLVVLALVCAVLLLLPFMTSPIQAQPAPEYDFGDAPDNYGTTLANNGPRHIALLGYCLGANIDGEPDGQPSILADGDDLGPPSDDEDGVVFTSPLIPGQNATITVTVTIVDESFAFLNAWIDFNGNVTFDHLGIENIFASMQLVPGPNYLNFQVPAGAVLGQTYARFRVADYEPPLPPIDGPEVVPVPGEVEDYICEIESLTPPPSPTPPPASNFPVGGEVHPTNKAAIVARWIALALAILAGGVILRRRRAYS
ncbi:GEVED domain-containing protein [Chloroflexota bacterium]